MGAVCAFMDIQIVIATHIEFPMPEDGIYLPLQVGAEGKPDIGYVRDNTGENISRKNPCYCELTGLYWMWKNSKVDYCGLVHYRRHFANPHPFFSRKNHYEKILDRKHLEEILRTTDMILPVRRNYYIESLYSHYAHSHYGEHLDIAREIIREQCPEYLESYDKIMGQTKAHMFNMMIMKKEKLDEYCSWLFPILEELERRIDSSDYDAFQARYPGRVSELLFNVWLDKKQYPYAELPVIMLGKVHWGRKIASFLTAKLFGKRYKQGF